MTFGPANPYKDQAPEGAPVDNSRRILALQEYESARKQPIVAWLLWLFLGAFGAHRFYLGHTGYAVAMLLLGWMTLGIWPLIDGLFINRNLKAQNLAIWTRVAMNNGIPAQPLPESVR